MKRKTPKNRNHSGYKVGYGRPPKATQFKKGTSGNKKGRPKGTKNIATLLHEEMYQKVFITENGQRRTIPKIQAVLKQLTNKAAAGDSRAIQAVMTMAKELPDLFQEPQRRTIKLNIFERDLATGERIRVKPGTRQKLDNDE